MQEKNNYIMQFNIMQDYRPKYNNTVMYILNLWTKTDIYGLSMNFNYLLNLPRKCTVHNGQFNNYNKNSYLRDK